MDGPFPLAAHTLATMPTIASHDLERFMRLAARLAVRGHGHVEPNPMVGCVVLDRDGAMVGWGYHRRIGGAHAEVEALKRAGAKARGGEKSQELTRNHASVRRTGLWRGFPSRNTPEAPRFRAGYPAGDFALT